MQCHQVITVTKWDLQLVLGLKTMKLARELLLSHLAIDDDVMISSPRAFAEAKNNSRRNHGPVIVVDVDSDYAEFAEPFSCGLYERFTPIMLGETATGIRAQSASQPVVIEQRVNEQSTSRRSHKGKAKASSSSQPPPAACPWEGEDVYYVPPIPGASSGKRPAASLGNSGERESSRGTKSTRSSADRIEDALSKISNFTDVAICDRKDCMDRDEMYKVENCQDIVSNMDIPIDWKVEIDSYLAEDTNLGQRIIFMRYDEAGRYAYVARHMRKKGEV